MGVEWVSALLALLYLEKEGKRLAEKKGRGKIVTLAEEILKDPIEKAGYLLWDVDFYKEGADFNLLVTIENPDGKRPIDLDDCEKVSRLISPILDEVDPIEENYYLEVSSAGLERVLTRPEHFSVFLGQKVRAKLYTALDGKKTVEGTLLSYGEEMSLRLEDGKEVSLAKAQIAKVTTVDDTL